MKNNIDPRTLMRPNIRRLTPYSTARDEFSGDGITAWIDANESPFNNGINRYPDPHQKALKNVLAKTFGISADSIFVGGAGSDEAIDVLMRVFCEPGKDNIVSIAPTYGVYQVAADINDIQVKTVSLLDGYALPVKGLLEAADANTKMIWICSPNNPTGNAFATEEILDVVRVFKGIVVVDEAYGDFSKKGSVAGALKDYPNLVVLRTLSKARGMASMRLGMAFADSRIASVMAMVKYPYNVNGPTQERIIELLEATPDISRNVNQILAERKRLEESLPKLPSVVKVHPSDANFLLVEFSNADAVYKYLMDHGVLVRNRNRVPGCERCLRITVGTPEENSLLLNTLTEMDGITPCLDDFYLTPASDRAIWLTRNTSETKIKVFLDFDNPGVCKIDTGLKFFDHMLAQIAHHGDLSLRIECRGDLQVDEHHTMEDVAIVLGDAINKVLGDKRGIDRYGFALPMDESRATVLLDLGGRFSFEWDVPFTREYVGDTPTEMFKHFFETLAVNMHANLHIQASGENNHHIIEGVFKAFARSLRAAKKRDPQSQQLPSSKGTL